MSCPLALAQGPYSNAMGRHGVYLPLSDKVRQFFLFSFWESDGDDLETVPSHSAWGADVGLSSVSYHGKETERRYAFDCTLRSSTKGTIRDMGG